MDPAHQHSRFHDFTTSDAVCARIYEIGLETNTYSDRFFANYQLHFIPTSLATRALFFFPLDAKLIVFTPLYTLYQYAPSVWLCFSSLFEVCFLKKPRKLLLGNSVNFYPFILSHSFCSLLHRPRFIIVTRLVFVDFLPTPCFARDSHRSPVRDPFLDPL